MFDTEQFATADRSKRVQITKAEHALGTLTVWATSAFSPGATLTVTTDGADAGADPDEDPFFKMFSK